MTRKNEHIILTNKGAVNKIEYTVAEHTIRYIMFNINS